MREYQSNHLVYKYSRSRTSVSPLELLFIVLLLVIFFFVIAIVSNYSARLEQYDKHMMCDIYGKVEYCK